MINFTTANEKIICIVIVNHKYNANEKKSFDFLVQ